MSRSTERFVFLRIFIYFVLTYMYVSSLMISSENTYGTRSW